MHCILPLLLLLTTARLPNTQHDDRFRLEHDDAAQGVCERYPSPLRVEGTTQKRAGLVLHDANLEQEGAVQGVVWSSCAAGSDLEQAGEMQSVGLRCLVSFCYVTFRFVSCGVVWCGVVSWPVVSYRVVAWRGLPWRGVA